MTPLWPRARQIAFLALLSCGCALSAAPAQAQPVTVKDAWVRAPVPGQKIAAAYLELVDETIDDLFRGFFVRPVNFDAPAGAAQFRVDVSENEGAFTLGQPVDAAGASAKYAEGVLELTLPKKAAAQVKRITIQ